MAIEEPEDPLHFPVLTMTAPVRPNTTIGQFYGKIMKEIRKLGNDKFTGDGRKQLTTGFSALRTMHIHDVESANQAIDLIVRQGEGTEDLPA